MSIVTDLKVCNDDLGPQLFEKTFNVNTMTLTKIDYEGKIKRKDFQLIEPRKPFVMMDLSKLNLNRYNMYYDN